MKCLLLNSTYENIAFVTETKALKLYFNNKVEIISNWDEKISWVSGSMKIPAIIKLKYYVRFIPVRKNFNRILIFKRDQFTCMYCNMAGSDKNLTVDHILPKSRGGLTSWLNLTTSCVKCNSKKDDKTPEEANMVLLNKPYIPKFSLKDELHNVDNIHEDWALYLK